MAAAAVLLFQLVVVVMVAEAQLAKDFYKSSCPNVESTVRSSVLASLVADPTTAAALLRLAFHDCQVGGCDASILMGGELASGRNFGVRRVEVIEHAKAAVNAACGSGVVSCADIIALAARDAVALSGGPHVELPLGRRDAAAPSAAPSAAAAADAQLPPPHIGVDALFTIFGSKGMSPEEAVAILGGGHTLGVSHCVNIVERLYPRQDARLGQLYAARLRLSCPFGDPRLIINASSVQNDFTALRFDNRYFGDVATGLGLLGVDASLAADSRTAPIVARFAASQSAFFAAFSRAFVKLTSTNTLTGTRGHIRSSCAVRR